MAGLVVIDVDLKVTQQAPAMLGDAEEAAPGAVSAAGSAAGLAATATALTGRGTASSPAGRHAVHGSGARCPRAPRWGGTARPEQGPGQGSRVEPVQDHPDRLLIRRRYRPAIGSHGARSRARSAWPARLTTARPR